MFNSNKDIDLLIPYNYEEPFYIKYRTIIKLTLPIVLIVALFGGGFILLRANITSTQRKINDSQKVLSNLQDELAKNGELDAAYKSYVEMKKTNVNLQAINSAIDSYPTLSKTAMLSIEGACSRSTIKNIMYSEQTGTVTIYLETEDVTQGENIVRTLKSLHYFKSVTHQGYAGNEATTVTETTTETSLKYNMTITCSLEGGQ